eukprot:3243920-Pleurochrysis_carterae.AAC.1
MQLRTNSANDAAPRWEELMPRHLARTRAHAAAPSEERRSKSRARRPHLKCLSEAALVHALLALD